MCVFWPEIGRFSQQLSEWLVQFPEHKKEAEDIKKLTEKANRKAMPANDSSLSNPHSVRDVHDICIDESDDGEGMGKEICEMLEAQRLEVERRNRGYDTNKPVEDEEDGPAK